MTKEIKPEGWAEAIDYVFNNMEYDYSEIEEEVKEVIKLTLKFKEKEMLVIIEEELKIDEDMPILKKHIEQIRNRIKQKLKGAEEK